MGAATSILVAARDPSIAGLYVCMRNSDKDIPCYVLFLISKISGILTVLQDFVDVMWCRRQCLGTGFFICMERYIYMRVCLSPHVFLGSNTEISPAHAYVPYYKRISAYTHTCSWRLLLIPQVGTSQFFAFFVCEYSSRHA
jgi:hypothetical protein